MANDDHDKSRTPQTDEGKRLEPKKGFERLSDADRALIAGAENTGDPSPGPTGPPVTVTANPPPPSPPSAASTATSRHNAAQPPSTANLY